MQSNHELPQSFGFMGDFLAGLLEGSSPRMPQNSAVDT